MPVLFFLFWILLNARVTVETVASGMVVAALISLLFYRFIGLSPSTEIKILKKIWPITLYVGLLFFEVVRANAKMIRLVLSPTIKTNPQIKYFDSPVRSDMAKMAFACSINLTPGTIFVEFEDGKFGVHAIDAKMLEGMEDSWILVKRLREIEGGHDDSV